MLTKEEKDQLVLDRANAKVRCAAVWETILHIRKILKTYETEHWRWSKKFERADRALAEEEKLTKVPSPGKEPKQVAVTLTREQVLQIAKELGVEIRLEEKGGEEDYV